MIGVRPGQVKIGALPLFLRLDANVFAAGQLGNVSKCSVVDFD